MNFRFLICAALSLISVSAFAQKTKTVVVYDSPDHSEWHTEKVVESNYAPYEFAFDLDLLKPENIRYRQVNDTTTYTPEEFEAKAKKDAEKGRVEIQYIKEKDPHKKDSLFQVLQSL